MQFRKKIKSSWTPFHWKQVKIKKKVLGQTKRTRKLNLTIKFVLLYSGLPLRHIVCQNTF